MGSDSTGDPLRDPARLAALRSTELLDASREESFDRLTRLVSRLLRVPTALVSLVDEDRQFFPACVGLPEPWASQRQTPLSHSFCQHVVASAEPLVIEDAREHPLVRESLAIPDLNVVAYAGIPLFSTSGQVLGSLCAIDEVPRRWTEEEIGILSDLAASVMTEIALREGIRERDALARDLRASEVRALNEEARVRGLLESTSEGIYGVDHQGRCIFVNRAAADVLGYAPDELLGREMHALIHHSRSDGTPYPVEQCPIADAAREGATIRLEDECLWRRDGSSFPAEYAAAPLVVDGEVQGAVVTFSDITERTRARAQHDRLLREAEEARARAEEAVQARDEVLGIVAHDLRNPVGTVFTAASLLLEIPLPPDQRTEQIRVIQRASTRADRLIQDLLDVARIEAGRLQVEARPEPVGELLAALEEWAPVQVEAAGQHLEVEVEPEVRHLEVVADRHRVNQIFTNLIGNAVKFTPRGGRIAVRAQRAEGGVRFVVSDTGSGIPADLLPRLFTRFWQAVRTDKRGAGLGLAIVKGLVDALGGSTGVESTPGQGTTIWITLPVARKPAAGAGPAEPAEDSPGERVRAAPGAD